MTKVTDLVVKNIKNGIKTYGVPAAEDTVKASKNISEFLLDIPFLGYIIAGFLSLFLLFIFMLFYATYTITIYEIIALSIGLYIALYILLPKFKVITEEESKDKHTILITLTVIAFILIVLGLFNFVFKAIGIHTYSVIGMP